MAIALIHIPIIKAFNKPASAFIIINNLIGIGSGYNYCTPIDLPPGSSEPSIVRILIGES